MYINRSSVKRKMDQLRMIRLNQHLITTYALTFLSCCAVFHSTNGQLPPQAVFVDPKSFAVLSTFRNSSFTEFFNPTSTQPPFFQIFDSSFLDILGANATINQISSNNSFLYAHEAPIYYPATDEVFFCSHAGDPLSFSDVNHNNQVAKISIKEAEEKLANLPVDTAINVTVTKLDLPDSIQMTNGGTGPYYSNLLFVNSGRGPLLPPTLAFVNPYPPYNATVLLNNFYGRQYNSINDVKIHASGNIFFTDPAYGYPQGFRPPPVLPNQVYRFDPKTGAVRVAATDFSRPNGIAFSPNGKTAYITDTGAATGSSIDLTGPATIYAFDVHPTTYALKNRRVFAYADTGIPDGIQLDADGNVYSGCGDGVQIWNSQGILLGKIFVGGVTPQVAFAGDGRLVILSEFRIFLVHLAAKSVNLSYPTDD